MAAKGTVAKAKVIEKIKEALGADFIGEVDKKIYVWADDGGEKIQVALALTCPKVPIEVDAVPAATTVSAPKTTEFNWGGYTSMAQMTGAWTPAATPAPKAPEPKPAVEITQAERDRIAKLIEKLNL